MAQPSSAEQRRCPGERYDISVAICVARQANHYPKCLLCRHRSEPAAESETGDPRIKSSIFRTTSIAGRVPSEINEYVVRKIGRAAAQYLRAESAGVSAMVVGCDLRENSRNLSRIFCEGANAGGLRTVSIGTAPPDMLRFALITRKFGAAAFISGCHAAANVNGIRLYRGNGVPLTFERGLDKIGLIARRIRPARSRAVGQRDTLDPLEAYRSYVLRFAGRLEPFTIVLDASCGIAGSVVPRVFEKLPVKVRGVHCEADRRSKFLGQRFPAPEVQQSLRAAVRSSGARLGAAIDFDGDLVVFCDELGNLLRSDVAAALIGRELVTRTPGARIAYDLRFTGAVREEIVKAGGHGLRTRADPLALAQATQQRDAVYAADALGRHFFRDMLGSESPTLALLLMCCVAARQQQPLSRLAASIRRYSHSGELRYEMPSPEAAERVIADARQEFKEADQDLLDGLTCRLPNWWFNMRQPPGSASLRVNIEGRTRSDERRGRMILEQIIRRRQARRTA